MDCLKLQGLFARDSCSYLHDEEDNSLQFSEYSPVLVGGEDDKSFKSEDQGLKTKTTPARDKKSYIKIFKKIGKPEKAKEQPSRSQSEKKKGVYMFPGESKNIAKNFTRALKSFIPNHFDSSVQQNPEIKKFLATEQKKACKQTLENSLKNCQLLNQISYIFFGNLKWGTIFLEENKAQLEQYFRFNQIWFGSRN